MKSTAYARLDVAALANVPAELREKIRFVCWREEVRNGKPTKVPVNPHRGQDAESDNPGTWGTLTEAVACYEVHPDTLHGVGRMFDPADGIIGIDFDKCLDDHGAIKPGTLAAEWLPKLNSYSEVSPSGKGIKTWIRATHVLDGKTGRKNPKLGVEVYRSHRYFTVTGRRLPQFSGDIEVRQSEVDDFVQAVFPANKHAVATPSLRVPSTLNDAEIIRRASEAKNGPKFLALWNGNIEGHGSQSEADAALCSLLWFWTNDREAVDNLFRQSGLMRPKWNRADYQKSTLDLACKGEVYSPTNARPRLPTDAMGAALNDPRPKIRLPGDDRLLSDFSSEVGAILSPKEVYIRNGEIVMLDGSELRLVTPQMFRTLVERHCICYRQRTHKEQTYQIGLTMRDDDARGVLASPQFVAQLRRVRRLNSCRQPIQRTDGKMILLPVGYYAPSQTLTLPGVEYVEEMALTEAVEAVNDLLGEFVFTDARSKAVAVAALVGLYAAQLLPEGALRPCFIVTKNAEGAGATTLVMCSVVPVLGVFPTGVKADDDAETRKALTAAVREAKQVILLDNQRSRLASAALEAFLSSPQWCDRVLGENSTFTGPNIATVFASANGCTVNPDMRRRSLFIELHLDVERAEDRQFRRPLDLPTLLSMRPSILGALWALVRHWDTQGRPAPTRSHSAFASWAKIVGGIVEAAGFSCPLETATVAAVADTDGEDMQGLIAVMEVERRYTFAEIVEVCQANGCFEGLVGETGDELKNASRVAMSRLLLRYECRLVGERRFQIEGKGHARRYHVECVSPDARSHAEHAVPADKGKQSRTRDGRKERAERVSVQPELAPTTTTEGGHDEQIL